MNKNYTIIFKKKNDDTWKLNDNKIIKNVSKISMKAENIKIKSSSKYKQKIYFYLLLNAKEDISKHFECFIVFCTKSFDLCQSWKKIVINVCNDFRLVNDGNRSG